MSDEITDPIAALRHELSSVVPSSDFATRVRERLADDLDPLRAELADLTTSPEFAVRVRQSIEASRRPAWGFNWRWVVPAAGVAAAMVAVVLWPRQTVEPAQPPAPTVARVDPAPPPRVVSSTPLVPRAAVRRLEAGSSAPATPRDPMLEVITNQPEILRELWARAGAVTREVSSPLVAQPVEVGEVVVAPIEVEPVVVKWLAEPPKPLGLFPVILRIAADAADRSAK